MKTVGHSVFTIVIKDGTVLFVRHTERSQNPSGTYGLPGGKVRTSESPADAATREVFEETGLRIKQSDLVPLGTHSVEIETKSGREPWTASLYLCKKFHGQIRRGDGEEPVWLSIVDVLAGIYKMPQMSSSYLSLIQKTLRKYAETVP